MFANFFHWWFSRLAELLPEGLAKGDARSRNGLVVDASDGANFSVLFRRRGQATPANLGAAARQTRRMPIFIRPPASAVLVKHHSVPKTSARQLDQLLRHELGRITPFQADKLYWCWENAPKQENRTRTEVILTMVPRVAVASALAALEGIGLKPNFIEIGPVDRPRLLPIGIAAKRSIGMILFRWLMGLSVALAVIALALPVALQAIAIYHTEAAIEELQPTIAQVDALRRGAAAGDAGRDVLVKEAERTGDVLQTLAMVTRILPNDTYLTDFSVRERQMTLTGRSASAPHLITALSDDPAVRNTAFAAPVTRIEGATTDVFSIKAEVAK